MSKVIADAIRAAARKIIGDSESWHHTSPHWKQWVKPFLSGWSKHEAKKKFINAEEAHWWASSNTSYPYRVYKCDRCVWWHLTSRL